MKKSENPSGSTSTPSQSDTPTVGKESREQRFKRLFPWMDPKYASHPWIDPEEYNQHPLPPDLQAVKEEMEAEFTTPYDLPWLAGSVLKKLVDASQLEGAARSALVQKAWDSVRMSHLADRARGRIRVKDENAEPMPEEVKQHLKELNEQRREEKKALTARRKALSPPKKPKAPVFADAARQKEVRAKYPWVVAETFRQDPEKAGGTIVDINCQKRGPTCLGTRTLHLADVFQTKFCLNCRR